MKLALSVIERQGVSVCRLITSRVLLSGRAGTAALRSMAECVMDRLKSLSCCSWHCHLSGRIMKLALSLSELCSLFLLKSQSVCFKAWRNFEGYAPLSWAPWVKCTKGVTNGTLLSECPTVSLQASRNKLQTDSCNLLSGSVQCKTNWVIKL